MSFYVVLPSSSDTARHPENKNNSYKVRLPDPIRLEGEWEVGLASVSLPDTAPQLKNIGSFHTPNLLYYGWRNRRPDNLISGSTILFPISFFNYFRPTTGRELANIVVGFCNNIRLYGSSLQDDHAVDIDWRANNGKLMYCVVKLDGEDLVIDNSNTDTSDSDAFVWFDVGFAKAMGWVKTPHADAPNTYELGPNIIMEYLHKGGHGSVDLDAGGINEDVWRPGTQTGVYWAVDGGWLKLSFHASWRFTNLDEAFKDLTNHKSRSLFIYCSAGKSQIVGNKITDLLREVPFSANGLGSQYYEPTQLQYKPVRSNHIDIIEVEVSETDGSLATFEDGVTTLTLHFKRSR